MKKYSFFHRLSWTKLSVILTVISSSLTILTGFTPIISFVFLMAALCFTLNHLWRGRYKTKLKAFYSILWVALSGLLSFQIFHQEKKELFVINAEAIQSSILQISQEMRSYTSNISSNQANVNNNFSLLTHATINGTYVQVGNGNTMRIHNSPPQRHFTRSDKKKILLLPSATKKIRIVYPENDKEAAIFADEFVNELFKLGYTDISKASTTGSFKPSSEKFTIDTSSSAEQITKIFINPK